MQRDGGAWDDSDLSKKNMLSQSGKKITKKPWSNTDKEYAEVGVVVGGNPYRNMTV